MDKAWMANSKQRWVSETTAKAEKRYWLFIFLLGFYISFPQLNIFSVWDNEIKPWNEQKKKNKQKETTTTHTYNLIRKPHIHTYRAPNGLITPHPPLVLIQDTMTYVCNINKLTLQGHVLSSVLSLGCFLFLHDWLEQTTISNTMPHATYRADGWRVMKADPITAGVK